MVRIMTYSQQTAVKHCVTWSQMAHPVRISEAAEHGVGFAAAGLAVGIDAGVVACQAVLHHALAHHCSSTAPASEALDGWQQD